MMKRKGLLTVLGAAILASVLLIVLLPSSDTEPEPERTREAQLAAWQEMMEEYAHVRQINMIYNVWPEGWLGVSARTREGYHYLNNIMPDYYKGWPVRVVCEEDRQPLLAASREMWEEYGHIPQIRGTTYNWPVGRILVETWSMDDYWYVRDNNMVPDHYNGWPVRVVWVEWVPSLGEPEGSLPGLPDPNPERHVDHRPLLGGIAISRYEDPPPGGGEPKDPTYPDSQSGTDGWVTGTLGMVTYNNKLLSNAHVIAMDSDGNMLDIGEPVYQPYGEDYRIGELEAYIPISYSSGAENYADAAIATVDSGIGVDPGKIFGEEGHYWINGWTTVSAGNVVRKSGARTGVTTAVVVNTDKSFELPFGYSVASFADHIEVKLEGDYWSYKGDSGSAVDKGGEFVGLHMGGRRVWYWDDENEELLLEASYGYISKAEHIIAGLDIVLYCGGGGGAGDPPPFHPTGEPSGPVD